MQGSQQHAVRPDESQPGEAGRQQPRIHFAEPLQVRRPEKHPVPNNDDENEGLRDIQRVQERQIRQRIGVAAHREIGGEAPQPEIHRVTDAGGEQIRLAVRPKRPVDTRHQARQ